MIFIIILQYYLFLDKLVLKGARRHDAEYKQDNV
jgi:hypothetical protein